MRVTRGLGVIYFGKLKVRVQIQILGKKCHKLESFTTSKTDRHLLCQKVRQRISVMKTNTAGFVVFKTKHELKCQFSGITEIL
jgi:hypothetical protein